MKYVPLNKIYYEQHENYDAIYKQRYENEETIHFPFSIKDAPAFFVRNSEIFDLVLAIEKMDKRILDTVRKLPGVAIQQFAVRSLIDEIMITNNIEGVHSTRKELWETFDTIDFPNNAKRNRFHGLINKYNMLEKSSVPLKTCSDIRAIYDELVLDEVKDDDPTNVPDGEIFRKGPVSVASETDKEIHRGLYPEAEIIHTMEQALEMLDSHELSLLIRIALFHYLFGYIHPFYEGNGRTSRFISSYLLSTEYVFVIGYRISFTIKENIRKYYKAFQICNDSKSRGDLTPFIILFLEIIQISFKQLEEALIKRKNQLDLYRSKIPLFSFGQDDKYIKLYDYLIQASLFSERGISILELTKLMTISQSTLYKRLKRIDAEHLLVCKKAGAFKYYSLDIDAADRIGTVNTTNSPIPPK